MSPLRWRRRWRNCRRTGSTRPAHSPTRSRVPGSAIQADQSLHQEPAYAASKGAVRIFTKVTASQHAKDKIRCNSVHPGPVDTDMLRSGGPGTVERVANISHMKRTAHPDEMIGPALLLVSDAGSYITGQLVTADGGYAVAR